MSSPRNPGRFVGLLYLLVSIPGAFALVYVPTKLIVDLRTGYAAQRHRRVLRALYPIYVRGNAYFVAHRGAEAATEFQKILDRRGIVLSDPIGALANLGVARAYTLSGDTAKARSKYEDFFALWKDADPDIPILKHANAEYARLKGATRSRLVGTALFASPSKR
jgi:hypothetical protein